MEPENKTRPTHTFVYLKHNQPIDWLKEIRIRLYILNTTNQWTGSRKFDLNKGNQGQICGPNGNLVYIYVYLAPK